MRAFRRPVCRVFYRADPHAVRKLLPDIFEPAADGFVAACGLSAKWTGNYGAFNESFVSCKCVLKSTGETGYFAPAVFLNSWGSIPAGREIYGTPKVTAEVDVGMEERVMYTHTRIAGANVLSVRSTMHEAAEIGEMPVLAPAWRLKVIPRADGAGAEVCQLLDCAVDPTGIGHEGLVVHVCRKGSGVVQLDESPIYNLSGLKPIEYLSAFYVEQDYTEGFATVVKDYLRPDEDRSALRPRL